MTLFLSGFPAWHDATSKAGHPPADFPTGGQVCLCSLTTRTGHAAWRTTDSALLPSTRRDIPDRPCVPITIMSASYSRAAARIGQITQVERILSSRRFAAHNVAHVDANIRHGRRTIDGPASYDAHPAIRRRDQPVAKLVMHTPSAS
jgi:hypothetical protein